jgi:hypothetical protein
MIDLSTDDLSDLRSRLEKVLTRVEFLFSEIGPRMKEIGHLREEASLIYTELERRGVVKKDAPERDVGQLAESR